MDGCTSREVEICVKASFGNRIIAHVEGDLTDHDYNSTCPQICRSSVGRWGILLQVEDVNRHDFTCLQVSGYSLNLSGALMIEFLYKK